MRFRKHILAILFFLVATNGVISQSKIVNFGSNPGNLGMYIYTPKKLPKNNISLIVVLHGCSQNAKIVAKQSGWNKLADENGFIVVYPQQKTINNPSNCFNWFNEKDQAKNSGENASILQMIRYTLENYSIDTSNIFVYGLSAGAVMSVIMMANYPDTFHAGAVLAGGPFNIGTTKIESLKSMMNPPEKTSEEWGKTVAQQNDSVKKYPNLIIVHGTKDKISTIKNSYALVKQWSYLHHLDSIPAKIDTSYMGNPIISRISYMDSSNLEKIIFYKMDNIGHTLPVDPGNGEKQGGKTGLFAKDIGFFSTYYIAKGFGLLK